MDREAFAVQVRDALAHFRDRAYLQTHPLTRVLLAGRLDGQEGARLQRLLLATVEEMKPQDGSSSSLPESRRYRCLNLRYVRGLTHEHVAQLLSISYRQAHRDHHEALDALVGVLWSRCERLRDEDDEVGVESSRSDLPDLPYQAERADEPNHKVSPDLAVASPLESELLKFDLASGHGPAFLSAVLSAAINTISDLATSRGMRIRVLPVPEGQTVTIGPNALRHALLGALSYVLESGDHGEMTLSVTADATGVALTVSADTSRRGAVSPGPALEDARLRATRQILEMHGGTLEVSTGEARLLCLRLPSHQPATVLVIDDDPDFVRLLQRFVRGHPYQLVQAGNGERALRLATASPPQLVLLDVLLPSQDGWEILRQLRRLDHTRDVPVVICSVLSDRALAQSLGATAFLSKPVTQRSLLDALERGLAKTSGSPVSPAGNERTPPPEGHPPESPG